jgi:hypothetical protein
VTDHLNTVFQSAAKRLKEKEISNIQNRKTQMNKRLQPSTQLQDLIKSKKQQPSAVTCDLSAAPAVVRNIWLEERKRTTQRDNGTTEEDHHGAAHPISFRLSTPKAPANQNIGKIEGP